MIDDYPVLYSFRRCPYAIRARMAIAQSAVRVELREVVLKHKPQHLLDISPKATVPVLLLPDGRVIDESLDIMRWALLIEDKDNWLDQVVTIDTEPLINMNDTYFKHYLDHYKYADRHPENSEQYYREQAEKFLIHLESRLTTHAYLCGNNTSLADMAIFPFIRQFANVDSAWFKDSPYPALRNWLNHQLNSDLFLRVMTKYPAWQPDRNVIVF